MIIFSKIRWKNFLSAGGQFTEVSLNRSPTTLIVGENGAGKSTILDALCFGLFGKAFRNINKPQLVNSINGKDCLVEIEFKIGEKNYKVRRGIKPGVFEIYSNGDLIDQSAATKDYQRLLEENILKVNFKSFTQIVILGSATFTPFMQLPLGHRREIIEDILDIQIFSSMNQLLKDRMLHLKDSIKDKESKIEILKERVKIQQTFIENLQNANNKKIESNLNSIKKTEKEIEENNLKISALRKEIEDLSETISDIKDLKSKRVRYDHHFSSLEGKQKSLSKEEVFFQEKDHCPTCTQTIPDDLRDKRLGVLRSKNAEIEVALEQLKTQYAEIEEKIEARETVQEKISELNKRVIDISYRISAGQDYISKLQTEITGFSTNTCDIEKEKHKLKELAKEVLELSKQKSSLSEEKQYADVCSILLKDTGIKTKVIKQYLPVINKLVNKNLALMDFFVHFELDESFNEVIRSRHRDEFSYSSFSEGEKQRINLALLFTWRTIAKMKNSVNTNLLILDEIMDGSMDGIGLDYVMELLNEASESSNIFVISHRGDQLSDKFRSALKFEKKNNFSSIVA